jgi:hypothetical protein
MTARQLSTLLQGRRIGKDKYQALCPAHPDRHPSLQIAEGKKGVLLRCMSAGCDTRAILDALGMTWKDLFYGERTMTPALRIRLSDVQTKEVLERQLGLVMWLGTLEPNKRNYWAAAERRIRGELDMLRCRLDPLAVYRESRSRQWQCMNQRQRTVVLEQVWRQL